MVRLMHACMLMQDEHLGYTEHEQWGDLASMTDHRVLFSISEDRQVS
jgi:hypothetical protein